MVSSDSVLTWLHTSLRNLADTMKAKFEFVCYILAVSLGGV